MGLGSAATNRAILRTLAEQGMTGYAAIGPRGQLLATVPGSQIDDLRRRALRRPALWRWMALVLTPYFIAPLLILHFAPAEIEEIATVLVMIGIVVAARMIPAIGQPVLTFIAMTMLTQVPSLKDQAFRLVRIPDARARATGKE